MFDTAQPTSHTSVSQTTANAPTPHEITLNNLLDNTPDDSNLTTNRTHQLSTGQFDSNPAKRSQRSGRWKASFSYRVGHFLQGFFGLAAFRAAYVGTRGQVGEHRAGPMLVRYDSGSARFDQHARGRTQRQAKIASWSQFIGAIPTIPLSVAAAIVGGLCGLCARAHRSYQQRRMRDDNFYRATRDNLINHAMREYLPTTDETDSLTKKTDETVCHIYIAIAEKAADAWRRTCQDNPATPVTEATLKQEITRIVNAFGDLTTIQDRTWADGPVQAFKRLAGRWLNTEGGKENALVDQIVRTVADYAVRRHVMQIRQRIAEMDGNGKYGFAEQQLENQPLAMVRQDFSDAANRLIDETIPVNAGDKVVLGKLQEQLNAEWELRASAVLYRIMTTLPQPEVRAHMDSAV